MRVVVDAGIAGFAVDGVGLHDDAVKVVITLLYIAHYLQCFIEPVRQDTVLGCHLFVVFPQFLFSGGFEKVVKDKKKTDADEDTQQ